MANELLDELDRTPLRVKDPEMRDAIRQTLGNGARLLLSKIIDPANEHGLHLPDRWGRYPNGL